jgi:hypothetical protein
MTKISPTFLEKSSSSQVERRGTVSFPSIVYYIPLLGDDGLSKASSVALAKHKPSHLFIAKRNEAKFLSVLEEIHKISPAISVMFLQLDLGGFDSIKNAARKFLANSNCLDFLMLNPGIYGAGLGLTKEGYAVQFGRNHLGHAVLVKLLMLTRIETAAESDSDVRIVAVSGQVRQMAPKGGIMSSDLKTVQNFGIGGPYTRYEQSRLGKLLYAAELAKVPKNYVC